MEFKKVNIYFRTFGSDEYGMGHIYRSLTLAKKIVKQELFTVYFILHEEEIKMTELIIEQGFSIVTLNAIDLDTAEAGALIYDMPFLENSFVGHRSPFKHIIALDYFYKEYVSRAINLFTHDKSINVPFKVKEGIEFTLLNESILNIERNNIPCLRTIEKVLITFGSLDPKNHTLKSLHILTYFSGKITIIIGALFKHIDKVKKFIAKHPNLHIVLVYSPKGIGAFIAEADIVFCGGGTTIAEVIYIAKPALVYPQTVAELSFGDSLENKGLCLVNQQVLPDFSQREKLRLNCLDVKIGQGSELIIQNLKEVING
jgi:spore coat polysaccharide biosynthesis predicted glycosyltransferase SpsG